VVWLIVEDELVGPLSRGRIDGDQFDVGLATHHRPSSDVLHESGNVSMANSKFRTPDIPPESLGNLLDFGDMVRTKTCPLFSRSSFFVQLKRSGSNQGTFRTTPARLTAQTKPPITQYQNRMMTRRKP
jgi:hypothetical protein